MKELNNVPMYNTEEAASRLYRYAMDHPTYLPDENQHEPNWEAYEAAEVLYRYAQGTAVDMEDLHYALELDKALQDEGIFTDLDYEEQLRKEEENMTTEDIHKMLDDLNDLQDGQASDYTYDAYDIFYNPDEEQSSDEVQEFEFWFNR